MFSVTEYTVSKPQRVIARRGAEFVVTFSQRSPTVTSIGHLTFVCSQTGKAFKSTKLSVDTFPKRADYRY